MSLTASSRSAVNAPRMRRFSSTSTARSVPRLRTGTASSEQQCDVGEVGVAGEAVICGGVVHDQRLPRPLDVAQHRHRHRAFVAGAADRPTALPLLSGTGSSQSCRSSLHSSRRTPVAPVIAPSTSTTRECSPSTLVSELSACDADRIPSRSMVPVVTAELRLRKISGLAGAVRGGRVGSGSQRRDTPSPAGRLSPSRPRRGTPGGPGRAGHSRRVRRREPGRTGPRVRRSGPGAMAAAAGRPRAARRRRPARRPRKSPTAQARSASTSRSRCEKLPGASAARSASHRVTSSSSDSRLSRSSPSAARASPATASPRSSRAPAVG